MRLFLKVLAACLLTAAAQAENYAAMHTDAVCKLCADPLHFADCRSFIAGVKHQLDLEDEMEADSVKMICTPAGTTWEDARWQFLKYCARHPKGVTRYANDNAAGSVLLALHDAYPCSKP